jgi:hypothetical protein
MNDKEDRLFKRHVKALASVEEHANRLSEALGKLVETDGPKLRIHYRRDPKPGQVRFIIYNTDTEMVVANIAGSKIAMHPMHYQVETVLDNLEGIVNYIEEQHHERTAVGTSGKAITHTK